MLHNLGLALPLPSKQGKTIPLAQTHCSVRCAEALRWMWQGLPETQHPCGAARAPGQRLTYLVESRQGLLGV